MTETHVRTRQPPSLILVTDPAYSDDALVKVIEACAEVLPSGSFGVQLRDKKRHADSLRAFAMRLRLVTRRGGTWLYVNGDAQLAHDVGADGVHLGGDAMKVPAARDISGAHVFVSIAAHSDDAVRAGVRDGANAALVSAIFASPGKAAGRGVEALRSARAVAPPEFAIYALGGVDRTNAAACVQAGATGVAVIRALLLASDPAAEARAIHEAMNSRG